jgi:hypothetical protein
MHFDWDSRALTFRAVRISAPIDVGYTPQGGAMPGGMSDTEKYLFDLNGFIVVRGVLSSEEIAAANAAIDARQAEFHDRSDKSIRNTKENTPLAGDGVTPRKDMGGFIGWPSPDGDVFRNMLAHPKLVPYLNELCGSGYRLDHMPLLLAGEKGSEGFSLHGGTVNADGHFVPYLAYHYSHGKMYTRRPLTPPCRHPLSGARRPHLAAQPCPEPRARCRAGTTRFSPRASRW